MPQEWILVPQESTLVAQESILVPQEPTLAPQESTLVAQELTLVAQESTVLAQESNLLAQESTLAAKESFLLSREAANAGPKRIYAAAVVSIEFTPLGGPAPPIRSWIFPPPGSPHVPRLTCIQVCYTLVRYNSRPWQCDMQRLHILIV